MILINLAKMKQAKITAEAPSSALSNMSMPSGDQVGGLIRKVLVPIAASFALFMAFDWYTAAEKEKLSVEIQQLDAQRAKLEHELAKVRGFEREKEELERNELVLRKKLETVQKLIQQRDFASKSLINISRAMTKDSWLTQIQVNEELLRVKGSTTDVAQISDLMSAIEETPNFREVTLKNSNLDPDGSRSDFELEARRE